MKGTIKFYSPDRRFGFIRSSENSEEIFFHYNEVSDRDNMMLIEGEEVEFEIEEQADKEKKFRAKNVRHPHGYKPKEFPDPT